MSTKKTAVDITREHIAHALNGELIGTGISVAAGGRHGPFTVMVKRVRTKDLPHVIEAIKAVVSGRGSGDENGDKAS